LPFKGGSFLAVDGFSTFSSCSDFFEIPASVGFASFFSSSISESSSNDSPSVVLSARFSTLSTLAFDLSSFFSDFCWSSKIALASDLIDFVGLLSEALVFVLLLSFSSSLSDEKFFFD
jgi:hypothetical protein